MSKELTNEISVMEDLKNNNNGLQLRWKQLTMLSSLISRLITVPTFKFVFPYLSESLLK